MRDTALSHKGWGNPANQNRAPAQPTVSGSPSHASYRGTAHQPRVGHWGWGGGGALRVSRRWGPRKSRPLSLGKYREGACALRLRPLPGGQRDFGARGRRDSETLR